MRYFANRLQDDYIKSYKPGSYYHLIDLRSRLCLDLGKTDLLANQFISHVHHLMKQSVNQLTINEHFFFLSVSGKLIENFQYCRSGYTVGSRKPAYIRGYFHPCLMLR